MPYFLRRAIGAWSGGTRVEIVNWPGSLQPFEVEEGQLEVRVLAGSKPIILIDEFDIVERGHRHGGTVAGGTGRGTESTTDEAPPS